MKILVVDDEMPTRMIMKRYLAKLVVENKEAIEIDEAENGQIAIDKIVECNNGYHLVTLDWNMPKMDGYEALQELQKRGVSAPILMISAKTDQKEIDKTLQSGASGYIIKPFSLDQLREKSNDILKSFAYPLFV